MSFGKYVRSWSLSISGMPGRAASKDSSPPLLVALSREGEGGDSSAFC